MFRWPPSGAYDSAVRSGVQQRDLHKACGNVPPCNTLNAESTAGMLADEQNPVCPIVSYLAFQMLCQSSRLHLLVLTVLWFAGPPPHRMAGGCLAGSCLEPCFSILLRARCSQRGKHEPGSRLWASLRVIEPSCEQEAGATPNRVMGRGPHCSALKGGLLISCQGCQDGLEPVGVDAAATADGAPHTRQ